MTSVSETEPIAPDPTVISHLENSQREEKTPDIAPEYPPLEPDTGKILDTYA